METIREISMAVDTVPQPTATTPSTFTATNSRKLSYTGPDDLRTTLDLYKRIWLWFPTNNILAQIESYGQYGAYLPNGQTITLASPEEGQIVQGLLTQYQLDNVTASGAANVNGVTLNAGFPLTVKIPGQSVSPVTLDPVVVDATNSTVRVVEQR